MTHWQSPHMHAYFPALNSFPSLLGDMLADAIGCLGFTWVSWNALDADARHRLNSVSWISLLARVGRLACGETVRSKNWSHVSCLRNTTNYPRRAGVFDRSQTEADLFPHSGVESGMHRTGDHRHGLARKDDRPAVGFLPQQPRNDGWRRHPGEWRRQRDCGRYSLTNDLRSPSGRRMFDQTNGRKWNESVT